MHDLTELTPFERRLSETIREHVAGVGDPRPIAEIAAVAMGARRDPALRLRGWLRWSDPGVRVTWRPLLVVVLVAIALAVTLLVVGSRQKAPLSPNGAVVYPAWDQSSQADLLTVLEPDGRRSVLPSELATARCPVWSPDGTHLAYVAVSNFVYSAGSEVVVADPEGGHPNAIVAGHGPDLGVAPGRLAWSHDGTNIAVLVGSDLQVVSLAGGPPRTVASQVMEVSAEAWSPDDRRLAVEVASGTDWLLETVALDGSGSKVVATLVQPFPTYGFAWSPDGSVIAYTSRDRLWLAHADGTGAPVDVSGAARFPKTPFWSPDGQRLAFIDPDDTGVDTTMRIWVIDRDGGNQTALAAVPNGGSPLDVTWAPDGRSLVVVERDYPTYRLVQLPLDGGASDVLATFTGSGPISTVSDCPVSWRRLPTP